MDANNSPDEGGVAQNPGGDAQPQEGIQPAEEHEEAVANLVGVEGQVFPLENMGLGWVFNACGRLRQWWMNGTVRRLAMFTCVTVPAFAILALGLAWIVTPPSAPDVQSFLADVGLESYVGEFAGHGYTFLEDLLYVTDEELSDIGLLLPHRRRILRHVKSMKWRYLPKCLLFATGVLTSVAFMVSIAVASITAAAMFLGGVIFNKAVRELARNLMRWIWQLLRGRAMLYIQIWQQLQANAVAQQQNA